jgi:hypothetical protein|eukprot:COSAG02_NODE_2451_length_8826_cov_26.741836_7_plen_39_part_00
MADPQFPLKHAQKDMRFALKLGDEVRSIVLLHPLLCKF